ncbi:MAG TPA: hypothetical protein VHO24_00950 [Opitutaceae bacterium]|nr:hypothetical protein [Opitutaceae bacterium]
MNHFLQTRIRRVIRRHQSLRRSRQLTVCWALAALAGAGLILLQRQTGWASPFAFPLLVAAAVMASFAIWIRSLKSAPDEPAIARQIEAAYPELRGLLLTAAQQLGVPDREQSYLQFRVTQQALEHCQQTKGWSRAIPRSRVRLAALMQFAALAVFAATVMEGRSRWTKGGPSRPLFALSGINVTPGDTSIERGESLVVLARFGGALPPGVDMVINDAASPARKVPLVKSLGDPMFGGTVPDVAADFTYRLDYAGQQTREFKVKVFEHPRLARADVELKYPAYTQLPPKRIEDTRRVSAVEGTQLALTLQLNKPVVSATLIAKNKEKTEIPLKVTAGKAVAALADFPLEKTQSYELKLVDADGRANKTATSFVIEVQPNRRPELKLASPRGDVRPSALEEITFNGSVFDDFGAPVYGLAYTVAGQETKNIELGRTVPAKEKRAFTHLVRLEDLGVKPDDLVSWYLWADDVGPDGKVRRTSTDMFFAEVRPFEEIFREGQGGDQQQDQQQQQGQQGNQARRLTELQKQIINATWKLQREPESPKYSEDTTVVHDSQEQALSQATETQSQANNPRTQALWSAATKEMKEAIKHLDAAGKSPAALASALTSEQAAYQALLKLQARETEVARRRQRGGQGGGDQASQRQIDELDLTQSENRYETQRQARAPQSPERREQNQILNRLQELARRQQDVNERLKELQTALQAADTEQEKEEVRRELKRLQEEQQQMLADMDEVRQRMDRPENQSSMQQQRQQLDQTRDDVQRAADAAGQGSVAQALASGTRAQRQLQQMRDELRKQNSSEFSDDLRDMRNEARDLARQQEDVQKKITALDDPARKTLNDEPERKAALDQLEQQRKRMSDLVDRATQVSEQAETTEPLLSRELYDSVRKVSQDDTKNVKDLRQELNDQRMLTYRLNDRLQETAGKEGAGKSLEITSEMLKEGYLPQANQLSQKAGAGINELRRGVERAAESVLGDDAEALKLAQTELDNITRQLERELAQAGEPGQRGSPSQPSRDGQGQNQKQGDRPGAGGNPADPRQAGNRSPSSSPTEANEPGSGAGQQPDPNGQPGQTPGQAQGGRTPGETPSQTASNTPGQQGGGQQGEGQQGGQQPGGQQGGQQAGGRQPGGQRGGQNRNGETQRLAGNDNGGGGGGEAGGDAGRLSLETLMTGTERTVGNGRAGGGGDWVGGGPLTGENFAPWSDRLRDVEELLDQPALRDAVANARERARLLRQEYRRDLKKPDWTVVQLQVLKPLVEVRSRIAEELARRESNDSLVPIDRDPVPNRFAESVRRYYEELGKDK